MSSFLIMNESLNVCIDLRSAGRNTARKKKHKKYLVSLRRWKKKHLRRVKMKSLHIKPLIFCTIILLLHKSRAQNNPCPSVFQYSRDSNENFGLFTLNGAQMGQSVVVDVEFSVRGRLTSVSIWKTRIRSNESEVGFLHSPLTFVHNFLMDILKHVFVFFSNKSSFLMEILCLF